MLIEFLGTGGAITTPKPCCDCRACHAARLNGVPDSRKGPSIFVHGVNVLIDTPEEIKDQLNRAKIMQVDAGFYSHWHPDHTAGSRVWEMNNDWRGLPPQSRSVPIYLPQRVAQDFKQWLGLGAKFGYYQQIGVVKIHEVGERETVELNGITVEPFALAEDYVFAIVLHEAGKRVLIAMDELVGWIPPEWVRGIDLAILPMGIPELHPITGERLVPAEHPILQREATFEQTLTMIEQLNAKRVILTHIEEPFGFTHDDLLQIAAYVQQTRNLSLEIAYDTLKVEL